MHFLSLRPGTKQRFCLGFHDSLRESSLPSAVIPVLNEHLLGKVSGWVGE